MVPALVYPAARAIFNAASPICVAQLRMLQHHRRRALLNHLLMTPLDGAFALAQMNHVAVMVAQDLDFDVARLEHQLFE